MTNTMFYDQNGKPRLQDSFCVYCDFLGMRDIMSDSDKSEDAFNAFMEKVVPIIELYFFYPPSNASTSFPKSWDVKVFTDNMVLAYAFWSQQNIVEGNPRSNTHFRQEFGAALNGISHYQLAVALEGFFIRGGWTRGKLFINEYVVFGKPLVDAANLEKNADSPRVILSDDVKKLVLAQMAQFGNNPPHMDCILVDDADGHWFVNYLSDVFDTEGGLYRDKLFAHARIITNKLEYFKANGKKKEEDKFKWLANYHNYFCHLLSSGFDEWGAALVKWDLPKCTLRQLTKDG